MPKRIQLRRTRGWRMPPGAVKVDRSTQWGNSYRVGGQVYRGRGFGKVRDAAEAVFLFRAREARHLPVSRLRGKDLACWCGLCDKHRDGKEFGTECPDCAPCHADVLGELANRPIAGVPND